MICASAGCGGSRFTMPGGGTWALPVYELALLAESELSKHGIDDASLVVVTPEDAPLHLFGRAASERVGELLAERGIELVTGATPVDFEGGRLAVSPGAGRSRPMPCSVCPAWKAAGSAAFPTTPPASSPSTTTVG